MVFGIAMKKGRDAGFSSKRSGNVGSGPPLPDPEHKAFSRSDTRKSRIGTFNRHGYETS